MDRSYKNTLSVEQAKLRLLVQAQKVNLRTFIEHNPYTSLALSTSLGFILARNPRLLNLLSSVLGRRFLN